MSKFHHISSYYTEFHDLIQPPSNDYSFYECFNFQQYISNKKLFEMESVCISCKSKNKCKKKHLDCKKIQQVYADLFFHDINLRKSLLSNIWLGVTIEYVSVISTDNSCKHYMNCPQYKDKILESVADLEELANAMIVLENPSTVSDRYYINNYILKDNNLHCSFLNTDNIQLSIVFKRGVKVTNLYDNFVNNNLVN